MIHESLQFRTVWTVLEEILNLLEVHADTVHRLEMEHQIPVQISTQTQTDLDESSFDPESDTASNTSDSSIDPDEQLDNEWDPESSVY